MARITLPAVALLALGASAQSPAWNWNRGDASGSRQAGVAGPTPANATAPLSTVWASNSLNPGSSYTGVSGFIVPGGASTSQTVYAAGVSTSPTSGGLVPFVAGFNAVTGALSYNSVFTSLSTTAMYNYGAPAALVAAAMPGPVIVTGQGWYNQNIPSTWGTVVAASAATGATAWMLDVFDTIVSDVLAAPTGAPIVYVSTGLGQLIAVNTTNGGVLYRSQPLPARAAPTFSGTGMAQLTLSPDGTGLVMFNGTTLAGVNPANGSTVWTLQGAGGAAPPIIYNSGRIAWDAGTGLLFLPNGSSLLAVNASTGVVAYTSPYVMGAATLGPVVSCPSNQPYVFVRADFSLGPGSGSGGVMYAFAKATGTLAGTYIWDVSQYSPWGSSVFVDASGLQLYAAVLGPLVNGSTAVGGSNVRRGDGRSLRASAPVRRLLAPGETGAHVSEDAATTASRLLQSAGGSPYTTILRFNPAKQQFNLLTITPLPTAMQCGLPVYGPGPTQGSVVAACGSFVSMFTA